ncbi:MAG TPA: hypothetical protein VGM05_22865 [Planctomycetaceae bacterium]|jgi:hypothetical protein
MIKKLALGIFAAAFVLVAAEDSAFAQMGGIPGMGGGMGGMGGRTMSRPKRKLHKSKAPVLSPALNLLPEAATTFEGQFLLRQLPQEQALREYQQTSKSLDKLQTEITDTDNQIKTGLQKTSGHHVRFMDYGSYYSFGAKASSGGGR